MCRPNVLIGPFALVGFYLLNHFRGNRAGLPKTGGRTHFNSSIRVSSQYLLDLLVGNSGTFPLQFAFCMSFRRRPAPFQDFRSTHVDTC